MEPTEQGWAWSTRDYLDRPRAAGIAATKAIAAALIVREIARAATPSVDETAGLKAA